MATSKDYPAVGDVGSSKQFRVVTVIIYMLSEEATEAKIYLQQKNFVSSYALKVEFLVVYTIQFKIMSYIYIAESSVRNEDDHAPAGGILCAGAYFSSSCGNSHKPILFHNGGQEIA